jgi:hypothetical protein
MRGKWRILDRKEGERSDLKFRAPSCVLAHTGFYGVP